ncbi:MAG: nucleoside 2-deoxyribosyltransferase [Patescibacteria group bacterium]
MIVYFTASISKKDQLRPNYQKIVNIIKDFGHQIRHDHILNTSESYINKTTRKEKITFQKQVEEWIEDADCLIAETSHPSVSVGYEIGMALQMKKPILVLHKKETSPPSLFSAHYDENVVTAAYTFENIQSLIKEFLIYVETLKDTKFTFYISNKHARHLKTSSKLLKISQSAYLRNLIENDLQNQRDKNI